MYGIIFLPNLRIPPALRAGLSHLTVGPGPGSAQTIDRSMNDVRCL